MKKIILLLALSLALFGNVKKCNDSTKSFYNASSYARQAERRGDYESAIREHSRAIQMLYIGIGACSLNNQQKHNLERIAKEVIEEIVKDVKLKEKQDARRLKRKKREAYQVYVPKNKG